MIRQLGNHAAFWEGEAPSEPKRSPRKRLGRSLALPLLLCVLVASTRAQTTQEVIDSKIDLWGEAALKQPGGPSYEYFAKLLPPLRYVDTDFLHYPIVLCAPGSTVKARLVSNGSAINALARQPNWEHEQGMPVQIRVGPTREYFGADLSRLTGPKLEQDELPIVCLSYNTQQGTFGEEAFASLDDKLAASGTVLLKLDFPEKDRGRMDLRFEAGETPMKVKDGRIFDASGKVVGCYEEANWQWLLGRNMLIPKEQHAKTTYLLIFTTPIDATLAPIPSEDLWSREQKLAVARWTELINSGTTLEIPETVVQNAWRAMIPQQYAILSGAHMNYSASNQYARKYSHESGDSMRSLLYFNHFETAAKTIAPIFIYKRGGIELHDAAFKLEDLADYYFVTKDARLVRETRDLWQKEIDLVLSQRDKTTGLLPREQYCSDIKTPVISLNTNANNWRGLRDMAVVLYDIGEKDESEKLAAIAKQYRQDILKAAEKAWVRTVDPPFFQLALGEEEPPIPITVSRIGSYWNLVINAMLGSGLFTYDSKETTDILRYIQTQGGLCMGMTRVQSAPATWISTRNIDDLYGMRYALLMLKRDEPDRALVSFYGKLAQGFTRDTFYDGEATSIVPTDPYGRLISLPPNSTANASFMLQLRNLLVQDWDLDDDGRAETLRLLFATPRRWLEDGKQIKVNRAPTQFGDVSFVATSNLSKGNVTVELDLPKTAPAKTLLRLRLPEGWKIESAKAGDQELKIDNETMDITALRGNVLVTAKVIK
ncbi:MAG TPA: hypothetical protein VL282_16740 [Tepidisphaeraceae bacterium]|nr:hypothetical protein [Tepidisphaeraceae bacterium]